MSHNPYSATTAATTNHITTTAGTLDAPPGEWESPIADQYALGLLGEQLAVGWYVDMGYSLCATRVRCRAGEIDAVLRAPDGDVVFLEVKTRRGRRFGAAESVGAKKLATMRRCAAEWLARWEEPGHPPVRFDVCEVVIDGTSYRAVRFVGVEDGAC